jgi:hypothetical protein
MSNREVPIMQRLIENENICRISGYVNSKFMCSCLEGYMRSLTGLEDTFKEFAPDLHQFYGEQLAAVMNRDQTLAPPFRNSVFACAAFNFGPNAVSIPHKDHLNLAYGWCTITALGNFDPQLGGHIVFPELRLAVQFPPGSSIMIPSAALTHYNLPIRPHERRGSITQFSAGGIFRWIAYGHQLKGTAQAVSVEQHTWWEKGKGLYSIWPSLQSQKMSSRPLGRKGEHHTT